MSFSKQIAGFNKKAEKKALVIFRAVGLNMFGRIVKRTPVDTGRLRNNWQMTSNVQLGQRLFITNNLPYAQRIEDGYSQQAPAGMVKVTINEFDSIVNSAVNK
jgi:hypothetical protein